MQCLISIYFVHILPVLILFATVAPLYSSVIGLCRRIQGCAIVLHSSITRDIRVEHATSYTEAITAEMDNSK
jgi:hypothetical protein